MVNAVLFTNIAGILTGIQENETRKRDKEEMEEERKREEIVIEIMKLIAKKIFIIVKC